MVPHCQTPANAVGQREFDFRTVERALARLQLVLNTGFIQRFGQCRFGLVPDLVRTDPLFRPGGQLDLDIGEAEIAVHIEYQRIERQHFVANLVFSAEDMGIVLDEIAHNRIRPCSAPDGSLRWQEPNSAMRSGRSR